MDSVDRWLKAHAERKYARKTMEMILDERDEERAKRFREEYGRRRWIVSWQRDSDESWLARISGPDHPETIERSAPTRCAAISLAANDLQSAIDAGMPS